MPAASRNALFKASCFRPEFSSHTGIVQVMPHRCARLPLVAPADCSRDRMVLAPDKKPCAELEVLTALVRKVSQL